jgi:peptidoglycan hydrolase-like protein with peptidoglycan-binding domain
MKNILLFTFLMLSAFSAIAQTVQPANDSTIIFRANKVQIEQAQKILTLPVSGRLGPETRSALRRYQEKEGLRVTGTLNVTTLERLGIGLSDGQKAILNSGYSAPKQRVTPAQIKTVKEILRNKQLLTGSDTAKLDQETRAAIRAFQKMEGIRETGTLNKETLSRLLGTDSERQ